MKRFISVVCLLCVFAFTVPSANAIKIPAKKLYEPVGTNYGVETAKIKIPAKKLYEPDSTNFEVETAKIKIPAKRYYEQSNPDNIIAARRRIGRGPGSGLGG